MSSIKQLPISERPYEKLEMYGEKALSNSELIAIILKTGTKNQTAVAIAQNILSLKGEKNIRALQDLTLIELQSVKGIGKVKAIQIKALCEIAKRMERPLNLNVVIKEPKDVASILVNELRYEKKEIVKILILNTKNVLQKIIDLGVGDVSSNIINIRQIFEEVIKTGMNKFILVHNHPSGDVTPSTNDIEVTKDIQRLSQLMGLQFIDHIIIGDGKFQSIFAKTNQKVANGDGSD